MVIEALKAARDFIENDRQALAESLTVNGEIVFEDDTDRRAMAEYVNVLVVIDEALEQALAAPPVQEPVAALDRIKEALPEFRQQDDYLLAHGASLLSEHSHEILHMDTLRKIVSAAVAAERKRYAAILDADADKQEAEWRAHLASGKGGPATSLHTIPRAYAAQLRGHNTTAEQPARAGETR
jgi:hypothetical protein